MTPSRSGSSGLALAGLAVVLSWALLGATAASLQVVVTVPNDVRVGDRAVLVVDVALPKGALGPLLVTPRALGGAVEVVRGRLMRSDALKGEHPEDSLRFHVPIVARSPGTALIRVHVAAYVCEDRCRAVEVEVQRSVLVVEGS